MSRDEKVNAEAGEGSVFVEEVRVGGQYSVLGRGGERGLEAMNGEGGLGGGGGGRRLETCYWRRSEIVIGEAKIECQRLND